MKNSLESTWEADLHCALGNMAPDGFWQDEYYYAACPLHDDYEGAFSYDRSTRTWRCDVGCGGGDLVALGVRLWQCGVDDAIDRVLSLCGESPREVASRYPYLDSRGQFAFEILRYTPKGFATRIPVAWVWNDIVHGKPIDGQRLLYRLPEVLLATDVLIVEGEKDCETARAMGLVATCNPGGSSRWFREYIEPFRAKRVCVIADADESGRRHGKNIAGSLVPVAESVKMIEFLQVKDLTEWVEAGGTAKELAQIFSAVPPLDHDDVAGWWDPARTVRLQCEAGFLMEGLPSGEETDLEEEQSLQSNS